MPLPIKKIIFAQPMPQRDTNFEYGRAESADGQEDPFSPRTQPQPDQIAPPSYQSTLGMAQLVELEPKMAKFNIAFSGRSGAITLTWNSPLADTSFTNSDIGRFFIINGDYSVKRGGITDEAELTIVSSIVDYETEEVRFPAPTNDLT
jgi:hypothetical protein